MKIPEPLFKIINYFVGLLLKSPIHGFFSDSLLLIEFTGRHSGRKFETPVRYIISGNLIQCFTSKTGQWWKNVREHPQVALRVQGVVGHYLASVTIDDPASIRTALRNCLDLYPQDATYHQIRIESDGRLNKKDFEESLNSVVLVELKKVQ